MFSKPFVPTFPSVRVQTSDSQKLDPKKETYQRDIEWRQLQIKSITKKTSSGDQPAEEPAENRFAQLFTHTLEANQVAAKNCENMIGTVEIPVGIAGPVFVSQVIGGSNKTQFLEHELYVPLATTEGALVASTSRGCKAISLSGGAAVLLKNNGITRAPVFKCQSGIQADNFADWLKQPAQQLLIKTFCEQTSSHVTYLKQDTFIRGRNVYARFYFDTDEAMGMNMVTIALQHALGKILDVYNFDKTKSHQAVKLVAISGNVCADKKSAVINTLLGRGRLVQTEVVIPESVLNDVLKVPPQDIDLLIQAHIAKNVVGSNLAGSFAQNMQAANVVAAFFAATGQDLAHVVDSSVAFTSVEKVEAGLYVSVTVPNVLVGSVGGGTYIPAQNQAQQIIRPDISASKHISADQLAIALGVGILAAEISGLAALATNTLARAHATLARSQDSSQYSVKTSQRKHS